VRCLYDEREHTVKERAHNVNDTATPPYVVEIPRHSAVLPDTPYALWESGELHDLLLLPHDGTRVEIIGGEIVVSPAPTPQHGVIIQVIQDAFRDAYRDDPEFNWRTLQVMNLCRVNIGDGYIPDLLVMAEQSFMAVNDSGTDGFMPDDIEMAVEVTSPGGPALDRPPSDANKRIGRNKWAGYAQVEIPYYLLVDRSPKVARATLYSIPDSATRAYLHQESWSFGETITLPEPFDIEISTEIWRTWKS
jgi:Uma2 family endonuclease